MAKSERLYLGSMFDAAREARQLIAGMSRQQFDQNRPLQLAPVHLIQVIGEAARHVSPLTQQANSSIPWRLIIGMRNRIVHDYLNIDNDILWTTVTTDLDALITELQKIIPANP